MIIEKVPKVVGLTVIILGPWYCCTGFTIPSQDFLIFVRNRSPVIGLRLIGWLSRIPGVSLTLDFTCETIKNSARFLTFRMLMISGEHFRKCRNQLGLIQQELPMSFSISSVTCTRIRRALREAKYNPIIRHEYLQKTANHACW
jgi:hypothetical protein